MISREDVFAEYQALCEIVLDEYTVDIPDVRDAAALTGAVAEQAARVFYIVVGELYNTTNGAEHRAEGACFACDLSWCGLRQAAANASRFRALIPRLEELSRAA